MSCIVEPSGATLGAVVGGVSLTALEERDWLTVEQAFHDHAVLIFPAQHLDGQQQTAFGLRFGALDSLVADKGTVPISNQRPDGSVMPRSDPSLQLLLGNEGWHTDSSYMPISAKASILSAEIVPSEGGETEWVDMRAAYDALDDATRAQVEELAAYHSLKHSQKRAGLTTEPAPGGLRYGLEASEVPLRPLVKVHPITGRPALFIGRHAYGIPGLDERESERLLDELLDFACQPPRLLTHRWQPGDVAIWDNRCVLHRARRYDPTASRVLHHTRIAGSPATESALDAAREPALPSTRTPT